MEHQFTLREQIVETVNKLFVYTDNQEWTKLQEQVFTDRVELDMVSMGAKKPELVSSREICYRWEKAFKELDAVHHQAGNYIVETDGSQSVVLAHAIAIHYRAAATKKEQTREYVGSYELHLLNLPHGWRIDKFKFKLKYSKGNLSLE
jgi:hypothetical protein